MIEDNFNQIESQVKFYLANGDDMIILNTSEILTDFISRCKHNVTVSVYDYDLMPSLRFGWLLKKSKRCNDFDPRSVYNADSELSIFYREMKGEKPKISAMKSWLVFFDVLLKSYIAHSMADVSPNEAKCKCWS